MSDNFVVNGNITYRFDELLTVAMVMEVFDVTRITVYNWLGKRVEKDGVVTYPNGKFPNAFKSNDKNTIYVPLDDVVRYKNERLKNFPTV